MKTQFVTSLARRMAFFAVALPALAQVGNLQLSSNAVAFTAQTGATLPQTQTVGASSTGAALPLNVSVRYLSATEGWLAASASASSTPATITITATPTNLTPGIYTGQVLVVASSTQSALISVSLTVTTATSGSVLSASPSSLSLSSDGGYIAQALSTISAQTSTPFQVFTNTTNGGAWLSMASYSGTAPTTISVLANPAGLTAGVYSGTVSLVPTTGGTGLTIPITFTVSTGGTGSGFSVSPSTLSFAYQTGTATPSGQSVYVSNSSGIVSYTATVGASWLKLTSNNNGVPSASVTGTSNSNLIVYVDPTGLTSGTYTASVTVAASTGASQTISVTLLVSGTAILTASPSSLLFTYLPDSGVPASQTTTISTTGSAVNFTTSASSTGWLQAGPQSGSTTGGSNVVTVSISPVGLPAGTYTGNVYISTGTAILAIPVTLNVGTSSFSSITPSPATLSFQALTNGPSASQTVSLSSASTKSFIATASTSGGNWLQVTPSNGFTPATLTVTISPQLISSTGVYSGLIQISNLTDSTQLTIPVTMTLSGPNLSVSPQALNYSLAAGSPSVVTQNVQVSGSTGATFSASSDSAWLTVSPTSGSAPAQLSISATAANLAQGNYTGVITVAGGGSVSTITVNAAVGASVNTLTLTSTNLTFAYTNGGNIPPAQTISVGSSTGTPLNFTASARTSTGANWLIVTAGSLSTPTSVTVSVQPSGLAPGSYRGVITFTALGSGETRSAEVLLNIAAPAAPSLRTAEHGATRQLSSIAPGMIMSLKGAGLGPFNGVRGNVSAAGAVDTFYGGYRVFFDGVAAPILYLSDAQIDVIAPYSIAGRGVTRVTVENGTASSGALELVVSPDASPGIFTMDSSGRGQAAALNQNGTLNSASNPASANSIIVLYATGEGQTQPAGQDGRVIATDLRKPVLPVAVNIGGVPVDVLYAGSAPGQVSGLMQVNVQLNSNVPRGNAVPVELRVGPAPSPTTATVAIQ